MCLIFIHQYLERPVLPAAALSVQAPTARCTKRPVPVTCLPREGIWSCGLLRRRWLPRSSSPAAPPSTRPCPQPPPVPFHETPCTCKPPPARRYNPSCRLESCCCSSSSLLPPPQLLPRLPASVFSLVTCSTIACKIGCCCSSPPVYFPLLPAQQLPARLVGAAVSMNSWFLQ